MVAEPSEKLTDRKYGPEAPSTVDFRTRGRTGLNIYGGYVFEERLRELQGPRALQTYGEMRDNDATCGGIIYAIDKMVRQVSWSIERPSDHPNDRQAQEFLEECREDMDNTWPDFISEVFAMCWQGFSLFEILYKRRAGDSPEGYLRSKYRDGRIGWRDFSTRAANTITKWITDEYGHYLGVEQMAPPSNCAVVIPWEKLLHFRTSVEKNNPLGRSMLRSCVRQWILKRGLENVEAVGAERDLAGLPEMQVPMSVLMRGSPEAEAIYQRCEEIVTGVRRDEREGLLTASDVYEGTNTKMYQFGLVSSPGSKMLDTDKMIARYDQRIAMSVMADFMLLGSSQAGSFAMHADKSALFTQTLDALMDIVEETLNRHAVSRLFKLNNFQIDQYPRFRHGRVGRASLKEVGEFLANITRAGAAVLPNAAMEERLCEMADLPFQNPDNAGPMVDPLPNTSSTRINEHHEGDPDMAVQALAEQASNVSVRTGG